MKHLIIIVLSIFSVSAGYSQIHEIGVYVGGSNVIGDVGSTNYINPNKLAVGGIYKLNRSPRHSYRFSIIYSEINGADIESDDPRRKIRNYKFNNNLLELSAGIEYTFLDFNLHDGGHKATPYLFAGFSAANYDNYYFDDMGKYTSEDKTSWAYGIPFAIGFKTTFFERFIFAVEIGALYNFSDSLDGSFPNNNELEEYRFGNLNNNDWYVFSGITLTYTFGRNPCYCVD